MAELKFKPFEIRWITRLCTVNGEPGYFHTWEQFSKPIPASLLSGGHPAGVISGVYGIVEFEDGVKRVDPSDIQFCGEEHETLSYFKELKKDDGFPL